MLGPWLPPGNSFNFPQPSSHSRSAYHFYANEIKLSSEITPYYSATPLQILDNALKMGAWMNKNYYEQSQFENSIGFFSICGMHYTIETVEISSVLKLESGLDYKVSLHFILQQWISG